MQQVNLATLRKQGELATIDSILVAAGADSWSAQAIAAHKAAELAKAPSPSVLWKFRSLFDGVHIGLLRRIHVRPPAKWEVRDASVSDPYKSLPPRAIELMKNIVAFAPSATFREHVLMQGSKPLDPILEVVMTNSDGKRESRHILVWDVDGKIVSPPL